jgi:hypothetical protein
MAFTTILLALSIPGQVEQVWYGDVVALLHAGDAPGHVVEGHRILLQMTDALS